MDILKAAEKLMSMDESAWQRHSSPLSVYSRFSILPMFTFVIGIREHLGWWTLLLFGVVVLWTWLNPRLFSAPTTTNNWASMGTFGERVYLNQKNESLIPKHHLKTAKGIILLQLVGLPFWFYSLYSIDTLLMMISTLYLMFTKAWFVDRMVWLYKDVKDLNPIYQSWYKS
ncbi:hypothetical protein GT360_15330 [Vibrio astriarenae]|uniref:Uncharacterized protein n=1 Tax=Vibrio astriarenae TaxID=1481923 RepID=A0A7Z2YEY2_9VIBR|nr:DUF6653 family protein [Vibrio astriarenae]QIA64937.1 hypothetical protein GT360_15330 [Vibrio astriarenae]